MPWRGFEPRRLSAPPPQDGVSTSFTTRALNCGECVGSYAGKRRHETTRDPTHQLTPSTGPTGLEPATSRVTVECSNQTELRPLAQSGARVAHPLRHRIRSPAPHANTACHHGPALFPTNQLSNQPTHQ